MSGQTRFRFHPAKHVHDGAPFRDSVYDEFPTQCDRGDKINFSAPNGAGTADPKFFDIVVEEGRRAGIGTADLPTPHFNMGTGVGGQDWLGSTG